MYKFKVVGTRGKKRKKVLKLLLIPLLAVLALGAIVIYTPFGFGFGNVLAGEEGSGPGGMSEKPPDRPVVMAGDEGSESNGNYLSEPDEFRVVCEDEREVSFGPIGIGPNIKTGDYIDIRLMCADGTDYVVASKKELMDYNASTGMSVIRVRESELLTLNSAMADRNSITGVTLYAVRYVDPLLQAPAGISYQPNDAVSDQIRERKYDLK